MSSSRKFKLLGLLAASTGLPYYLTEPEGARQLGSQFQSWLKDSSASATGYAGYDPGAGVVSLPGQPWQTEAGGGAIAGTLPLEEILRFDISPRWVVERWPRVTTTLSEQGFQGLRVPFLTGVALDDLAGTVTYYFDRQQRLQRISLQGFAGDDAKLVPLVMQRYGLQPEPSLGAGMYTVRWNRRPLSVLRIQHAPIVRAANQHSRLQILLEINRPEGAVQLSQEMQRVLEQDQYTQRW